MKHLVLFFFMCFLCFKQNILVILSDKLGSNHLKDQTWRLSLSLLTTLDRGGNNLLLAALGDKNRVDVGKNTTLGNGDTTKKLVKLLVIANSKLDVAGDNTGLLVVTGSVTGKLKDLSSEVLEDGSKVDRGSGTNTGGELALLQVAANTGDRELKTGLTGLADRLGG